MIFDPALARQILAHARQEAPREACGAILERGTELKLIKALNIQDTLHALDATRPDAEAGYCFDPGTLSVIAEALTEGWRPAMIYHSHPNGSPRLSEEDRRQAAPEGEPLYPGTVYIVAANGRLRAYAWARGEYRRVEIGEADVRETLTEPPGPLIA